MVSCNRARKQVRISRQRVIDSRRPVFLFERHEDCLLHGRRKFQNLYELAPKPQLASSRSHFGTIMPFEVRDESSRGFDPSG